MYILTTSKEVFKCQEKPKKGLDFIHGYGETEVSTYDPITNELVTNNREMDFKLTGISDFSGYKLTDEQGNVVEFETAEESFEDHQEALNLEQLEFDMDMDYRISLLEMGM